ncbi:MAG: hypothetical protein QM308_08960 [Bacillota bacterium]|nr:hypothetical protein [Bacillota bacterium]
MKRMFAAMLAALMLVTLLLLASPPAQAAGVTFTVACSVDHAYVDETVLWGMNTVSGGSGIFEYSFDIYKNNQLISEGEFFFTSFRSYTLTSPGKYKVRAWVWDRGEGGENRKYDQYTSEITVEASVNKITKVEPVGATSLRITWNTVPGATKYHLHRSTDMKNWELIKETTATSFANTYLKSGTRYFYRVGYVRPGTFDNIYSPAAAGVPMAKTRITSITSPSARRIRMTWARAAGASGYQVAMASRANGSYKSVRIVTGGTTAIFSGVRSGSTLYFKVRPYRRVYTTTCWGQYSAYRSIRVK